MHATQHPIDRHTTGTAAGRASHRRTRCPRIPLGQPAPAEHPAGAPLAGADTGRVRIVEQCVTGKHAGASPCEDVIVTAGPIVAVIDGATDKSGRRIRTSEGDVTGGRFAALELARTIATLEPGAAPARQVEALTGALRDATARAYGPVAYGELPSASLVVYDDTARVVWRVGDCPFRIDTSMWVNPRRIDQVAADFRAAFVAASRHTTGETPGEGRGGIGRDAILPLLHIQGHLANTLGEFGYGAINGTPVPERFIDVVPVWETAREIVLASDGYPWIAGSLHEAETELARLLAADPDCVGALRGTKGLVPEAVSFDDRSWIRIALDTH